MSFKDTTSGERALSYFEEGNNCSVSVFRSLSEMSGDHGTIDPSIAMGFGGGMGKNGLVCGAVSAGIMAIGLQAKGRKKAEVYELVDTFLTDFKDHFGTVNCRELLGADLKTEEGMDYLKTEGRKKCSEFVRYAADKAFEMTKPLSDEKA
jgi:C_GCAxxG_C_C family probable redox protein